MGGIGYWDKMEIKFIAGKLNSKIDEKINTYATRITGNKYIFQRDSRAHRESNEFGQIIARP